MQKKSLLIEIACQSIWAWWAIASSTYFQTIQEKVICTCNSFIIPKLFKSYLKMFFNEPERKYTYVYIQLKAK